MSVKSPDRLAHLIDFAPADYHIVSLDKNLLAWHIQVERYHKPSRVGEIFVGIVRIVDNRANACFIDIGLDSLARLHFHHKDTKLPHIGQRIIVQCKRDSYAEKTCLMSLMFSLKKRYLSLKLLPHRWFSDQQRDFINLEKFTHIPILAKMLEQFANDHLFILQPPEYTTHWQVNPAILHFWQSSNASTDMLLSSMLMELEAIKQQLLRLTTQTQQKEKGSLVPPISAIDDLIYNLQIEDKIYVSGSKEDLESLKDKLTPYPDLQGLLQTNYPQELDSMEIIEDVLSPSHDLGENSTIKIEETSTLTALDVDAGTTSLNEKYQYSRKNYSFDINIRAIDLTPRLLLARNISGLIVIDPISTRNKSYARRLINALRAGMKQHHPLLSQRKYDVLGVSPSGLIELTRERLQAPLHQHIYGFNPWHEQQKNSHETTACNLLRKLYHQGIESPSTIPQHDPIHISHQISKLLRHDLKPATKKLEKIWQGVKLWQENKP